MTNSSAEWVSDLKSLKSQVWVKRQKPIEIDVKWREICFCFCSQQPTLWQQALPPPVSQESPCLSLLPFHPICSTCNGARLIGLSSTTATKRCSVLRQVWWWLCDACGLWMHGLTAVSVVCVHPKGGQIQLQRAQNSEDITELSMSHAVMIGNCTIWSIWWEGSDKNPKTS